MHQEAYAVLIYRDLILHLVYDLCRRRKKLLIWA